MFTPAQFRLGVGAPIIAAVIGASLGLARPSSPPSMQFRDTCILSIDDPIPIGPERTTSMVTFTEVIGDSLTAEFPEDAHVDVVSIKRTQHDGPLTATIVVSALRATAGLWSLAVHGNRGDCAGKVWVGQGVAAEKPVTTPGTPKLSSVPALAPGATAKPKAPKKAPGTCAAFTEDPVRLGLNRTEVLVKYTEPLGENPEASFPAQSRVEVVSVKHADGDEPRSMRLVLSTSNAVAGQWRLTLWGDLDTCTGNVYVGPVRH
ncbi:MAG TPA: hypothetical protein VE967_00600 [Gemmatimonadaceae bacterium]|nr:hypothetical protein [Gemmatimonadaceae bacterium]